MEIFKRLAIGAANFGQEYHGTRCRDIDAVLDYCQCVGIDMLDCADAYNWDWQQVSNYFKCVVKVQSFNQERIEPLLKQNPYCIMAHDSKLLYINRWWDYAFSVLFGASFYEPNEFFSYCPDDIKVVQLPYSLFDRRWEDYFGQMRRRHIEVHVRSVFLQGKILQEGKVDAKDCIAFALMNPNIDRVIIGVDSLDQLKRNLDYFCKLDLLKKDDLNLIDPRRWEKNK